MLDWLYLAALCVVLAIRTKTIVLLQDTSILFHTELDPYQPSYASWFIGDGDDSVRYSDSSGANFTTLGASLPGARVSFAVIASSESSVAVTASGESFLSAFFCSGVAGASMRV